MKKVIKSVLVFGLCLLLAVPVWADAQSGKQKPDYTTDYYMIVESKNGGIDMYSQPDLDSEKLNDELIPNGTALHIEGEVVDKDSNRTWGYTSYKGMNGYVPLDDCKPAQSRQEAIESELYIAGRDNVDYNADYDVTAYDESGSQSLYQGPGEKYGKVPGVRDIQNGETLHITEDASMVDGSHWGMTTVDGKQGWMDLDKTEENAAKESETVDMIAEQKTEATTTPEATPTAEATTTPEATPTVEATTTPEATPTAEATTTPEATPTAEATTTPEATPTAEPTITPETTETPEPTATQVPTVTSELTEAAQSSSSAVKKEKDSMDMKPFLWIALAAVVAALLVLIYHKKKNK